MKLLIVTVFSVLLCACANMTVTKTDVATPGGLTPLSSLDAGYRALRDAYVRRKAEGLSVRLLL